MTVHLSELELVEWLDGTLASARAGHLEVCESCRQQASALGAALADARTVPMPEPSPLFWDHLRANIRDATARESGRPGRGGWRWWPWAAVSTGALLVVIVGTGLSVLRTSRPSGSVGHPPAVQPGAPTASSDWSTLLEAADAGDWDPSAEAQWDVRPGSAEQAVLDLSAEEQRELVRLLQAELGATPAVSSGT